MVIQRRVTRSMGKVAQIVKEGREKMEDKEIELKTENGHHNATFNNDD